MSSFDAYAVTTARGPHVTMQAGVVHAGHHWTTTTRSSAKVKAIRNLARAAVTTGHGPRWHVLAGEAWTLDPTSPTSVATHPISSTLAGGAVVRLGLGRLDQLLGYAQVGTGVPQSFLPMGRVILVTRVEDELSLDGDDVVDANGRWADAPAAVAPARSSAAAWNAQQVLADIPDEIAELAAAEACGWLGVSTGAGTVALPAGWDPDTGCLRVSRDALGAVHAEIEGPMCFTLDESESRRPDEKLGMMLRGNGMVVDVDGAAASVAIAVERVTYWDGFTSHTKKDIAA